MSEADNSLIQTMICTLQIACDEWDLGDTALAQMLPGDDMCDTALAQRLITVIYRI